MVGKGVYVGLGKEVAVDVKVGVWIGCIKVGVDVAVGELTPTGVVNSSSVGLIGDDKVVSCAAVQAIISTPTAKKTTTKS